MALKASDLASGTIWTNQKRVLNSNDEFKGCPLKFLNFIRLTQIENFSKEGLIIFQL